MGLADTQRWRFDAMTKRTDADFAIEFGEQLAWAAESYMNVLNDLWTTEEHGTSAQVEALEESRSDHAKGLREAIYEFRKRAERAKAPRPEAVRVVELPPTPPTKADEKRMRRMGEHDALHELERLCCVIGRAVCDLTNLDALTLAGFDMPETKELMDATNRLIQRANFVHDEKFGPI
jgi:hypothetical protein